MTLKFDQQLHVEIIMDIKQAKHGASNNCTRAFLFNNNFIHIFSLSEKDPERR